MHPCTHNMCKRYYANRAFKTSRQCFRAHTICAKDTLPTVSFKTRRQCIRAHTLKSGTVYTYLYTYASMKNICTSAYAPLTTVYVNTVVNASVYIPTPWVVVNKWGHVQKILCQPCLLKHAVSASVHTHLSQVQFIRTCTHMLV